MKLRQLTFLIFLIIKKEVFKAMSFQNILELAQKENKQLLDQYINRTLSLPIELQKQISQDQKKLQLFIQNFQNEIVMLKKSQERDSTVIDNLRFENQQRISQSKLLQSATKMQQMLLFRLKNSLLAMQELIKNNEEIHLRHQQNQNRHEIDIQEMQKKLKNKRNQGNPIQIDKQNGKLLIRVDRNGASAVHQINYNSKQDKFGYAGQNKGVNSAVSEFNFHRNVGRLYSDILQI